MVKGRFCWEIGIFVLKIKKKNRQTFTTKKIDCAKINSVIHVFPWVYKINDIALISMIFTQLCYRFSKTVIILTCIPYNNECLRLSRRINCAYFAHLMPNELSIHSFKMSITLYMFWAVSVLAQFTSLCAIIIERERGREREIVKCHEQGKHKPSDYVMTFIQKVYPFANCNKKPLYRSKRCENLI